MVFSALVFLNGDDSTQTTSELQNPVLPVVSMDTGSTVFNALHGVVSEQNAGEMRPVLTPLSSGREITLQINPYETEITGLLLEVRNLSGERLIEALNPEWTQDEEGMLTAEVSFSNLMEEDTEYLMIVILSTPEFDEIRYYTRVFYSGDSAQQEAEEALEFALHFHEATFGDEDWEDLLNYLEPDSEEDNDSLARVTLYSSEELVTWADLEPECVTEPVYSLIDVQGSTYGLQAAYYIKTEPQDGEEASEYLYRVEEYYELYRGTDRFYLMDYERTVSRDFDPQNLEGEDGVLDLGIADEDLQVMQDDTGDTTAFVHDGRLFAVQESEKLMIYVFGFDRPGDTGERETFAGHDIRIMSVAEDGSIDFLVYGYMNTGDHEGEIGLSFYRYSGSYHTLEELVFLPYEGSWEMLCGNLEKVCWYNAEEGLLYLVLNDSLYEINVNACSIRAAVEDLFSSSTSVSDSGQLIAYEEEENGTPTGRIVLLNLDGMTQSVVETQEGDKAIPLGFLGEDLIYGTVDAADMVRDSAGIAIEPMSHIVIVDSELTVLEDYYRSEIYIISIEIQNGQVTLQRVQKTGDADNPYMAVENDEIVSSVRTQEETYTQITSTERYENTVQILIGSTNVESLRYIRPQELTYEGGRNLSVRARESTEPEHFYVYNCSGFVDSEYSLQDAVEQASLFSAGSVVSSSGRYLWRNSFAERAEIEELTQMEEGAALQSSLQVCIEALLEYEGVSVDVAGLLEQGMNAQEILEDQMPQADIYDLTGMTLDDVLYYVSEYLPVCAMTGTQSAVLIIGYGPENVELFDPEAGSVYITSRESAQTLFETSGSRYICYIPEE